MSESGTTKPDVFDFDDLTPAEKFVKYKGETYLLTEADEAAAVRYRNASLKAFRMADGKVVGMDGAADIEPQLVADCLYHCEKDGTLRLNPTTRQPVKVPVQVVRSWQSKVVKPLFDWVRTVSELEEKDTVDSLRKKIADLTGKLAALESEDDGGETGPKDGPNCTPTSSP